MPGYINGHAFITLGGTLSPAAEEVETWQTDGQDGYGARTLGKRPPVHVLRPVKDFGTSSARNSAINTYAGWQGSVVTIIDDVGNSARCLILNVQHLRSYRVQTAVGGINGGNHLLEMVFRVRLKN